MKKVYQQKADSFGIIVEEPTTNISNFDPILFQYYQELKKRRIVINEEIDENFFNFVTLPLRNMLEDGSNQPVEILLNTPGGSLIDALSVCDIIDQAKSEIIITVTTYAYSMGALILMAGYNNPNVHKRCYPSSLAMVHDGQIDLQGKGSAVRDTYDFYKRLEERIKSYVISHSKIDEKFYQQIRDKELYLFSDEMLKYGLVNEIIGQEASITTTNKRTRIRNYTPKKRTK